MRYVISIILSAMILVTTSANVSASVSTQRLNLGELLGGMLGGYGAAKLCGKGPATAVACGYAGSQIGASILGGRRQQPQYGNQQYGGQQYGNQLYGGQQYAPQPRNCQMIAFMLPDGTPDNGLVCMNPQGNWIFIQTY